MIIKFPLFLVGLERFMSCGITTKSLGIDSGYTFSAYPPIRSKVGGRFRVFTYPTYTKNLVHGNTYHQERQIA